MSFTTKIKNEIAVLEVSESEKLAELSAYTRNNAVIEKDKILFVTENNMIVKRVESYLTEFYDVAVTIEKKKPQHFIKTFFILLW